MGARRLAYPGRTGEHDAAEDVHAVFARFFEVCFQGVWPDVKRGRMESIRKMDHGQREDKNVRRVEEVKEERGANEPGTQPILQSLDLGLVAAYLFQCLRRIPIRPKLCLRVNDLRTSRP